MLRPIAAATAIIALAGGFAAAQTSSAPVPPASSATPSTAMPNGPSSSGPSGTAGPTTATPAAPAAGAATVPAAGAVVTVPATVIPATPPAGAAPMVANGYVARQETGQYLASDWVSKNIYAPDDTKIGDVNDLVIDASGRIAAIVIGVGGFLGMGEKNVAVPFTQVKAVRKDGRDYLTLSGATKADLTNAPAFTRLDK